MKTPELRQVSWRSHKKRKFIDHDQEYTSPQAYGDRMKDEMRGLYTESIDTFASESSNGSDCHPQLLTSSREPLG